MRPLIARIALLALVALPLQARTSVVLLHFSDYHSHALPFYSDGVPDQGGIARAVGYLRREKTRGALVFNGGDMINKGSPAWSDKYECVEWPWFDGIVSAMALGNHDVDYGRERFEKCRRAIRYPILSANAAGFDPYAVFTVNGIRIGAFAVAGPGTAALMKGSELSFSDSIAAARETVRTLREKEHVDAVVLIGHESTVEDAALARAVPGIDVIFGTHSHEKHPLHRLDDTRTWFIAPSQYLTWISRVKLIFEAHKLVAVEGGLVRVNGALAADRTVEKKVASLQKRLESDPHYAPLFQVIGTRSRPLSVEQLGRTTVEAMRAAVQADAALSTASSFRQALPAGAITMEALRQALPYDNEIVVAEMSGKRLRELLAASEDKRGTDDHAFAAVPEHIDEARSYRVAATDFMANVAPAYRSFFTVARRSGLHVRDEVRKRL